LKDKILDWYDEYEPFFSSSTSLHQAFTSERIHTKA
jgi:hypothetical protein